MNVSGQMAMPERLRILAADLSLRCPGFAVLQYEGGKISIERLCHLDTRRSRASHGEILAAIPPVFGRIEDTPFLFNRFPDPVNET